MEIAQIKALLDRYWQAETSLEEEAQLAAYFRQPDIDPDLESVREMFAWRDEEAQLKPAADFDQRLLTRISAPAAGEGEVPAHRGGMSRRLGFPVRFAAAAAVAVCLGLGLLIQTTAPRAGRPLPGDVTNVRSGGMTEAAVKDTYTDPRQALAAVQNALLLASTRMSEGEHITQKNITRLHKSWEVATGD